MPVCHDFNDKSSSPDNGADDVERVELILHASVNADEEGGGVDDDREDGLHHEDKRKSKCVVVALSVGFPSVSHILVAEILSIGVSAEDVNSEPPRPNGNHCKADDCPNIPITTDSQHN